MPTRATPALGDLDRDGDLDLVVGNNDGTFAYLANTGTAIAPAFAALIGAANPLDGFDVGGVSKPALADLDRDADLDLVAGRGDGTFLVYENTGTAVSPSFAERSGAANPLAGQQLAQRSAPALGDLDGDGDPDLVAGSGGGGTFVTLRNLRSRDALPQFAGNNAPSPALGDLDGDGDPDLVSAGLGYFENTGSGAFVQRTGAANPFDGARLLPPSNDPCSHPALGDVDGDGDLDLVAGYYPSFVAEFCYFENTGTATQAAFVRRTGTANPFDGLQSGASAGAAIPAFGDLDADGDIDLVAGYYESALLFYFENTGTSTNPAFVQNPSVLAASHGSPYYTRPTLGDLDDDGDLDCVLVDAPVDFYDGHFDYLENTGTAASPAFVLRTGSQNPFPVLLIDGRPALGDLDGDGDLDLVANGVTGYGIVTIFENTGLPDLPAFIRRPASDPISDLDLSGGSSGLGGATAFADLDRDGDVDLVAGRFPSSGRLRFYENTSTGLVPSFVERSGAANPLPQDSLSGATPAFADLDGDGDLDLLSGISSGQLYLLYYFENTGDATSPQFATRVANPFGLGGAEGAPAFGDVDGDGDIDLAVGFSGQPISYFENTGTPESPAFVERTGAANPFEVVQDITWPQLALADFDRDGDLDLIARTGSFHYFWNTGSATAPAFTSVDPPLRDPLDDQGDRNPAAVDLDGDGDLDLVDSGIYVYYAPEPARGLLFGAGALLLGLLARWRRRN